MANRTIVVKSANDSPLQKEWIMDAEVLPGMLVEYASSTRIQVLSNTIDPTVRVVVDLGDVAYDGTYSSGDQVPFAVPQKGDEILLMATASALSTLTATNMLVSDGAGFGIYAAAPIVGEAIAVVLESAVIEANDLALVKVEVL